MALGVATLDGRREIWCAGRARSEISDHPVTSDTSFDLASLTKPLTTLLWTLRCVERGLLSLTSPIGRFVEVRSQGLANTPLWQLLSHTTGLPAHIEYFKRHGQRALAHGDYSQAAADIMDEINQTGLCSQPGQVERYSDLGFLLLQQVLESVDGPLAECWPSLPDHGPDALHFRPLSEISGGERARYAPTERCPWRGRWLQGEVHDDNCWTMGGICGHAGLFGNIEDTMSLGRRFLSLLVGEEGTLGISPELMRLCCDRRWMSPSGTRVLGWDTPSPGRSSAGARISLASVGHLGFTGTSIWLDPQRQALVVLLTNRVSPSRDHVAIRAFRPQIHDLCWQWVDGRR